MEYENFIGFPKNEVLELMKKNNVDFNIVDFNENNDFDTQLLVKIEYINNRLTLYFDNFKLLV